LTELTPPCSLETDEQTNNLGLIVVKKAKQQDTLSFEEAMAQLESLVESMEQGELSLEASLESFEKGVKLTRICQQALKEAEQKVQILTQNSRNAELEDFERDS